MLSYLDFPGSWEKRRKKCRVLLLIHLSRVITPLPHLSIEMSIFFLFIQVGSGQIPGHYMEKQAQGKGLVLTIKYQTDLAGYALDSCSWQIV